MSSEYDEFRNQEQSRALAQEVLRTQWSVNNLKMSAEYDDVMNKKQHYLYGSLNMSRSLITKPTNILIQTAGSRGDVQPYIAIGRALQNRGYTVSIFSNIC